METETPEMVDAAFEEWGIWCRTPDGREGWEGGLYSDPAMAAAAAVAFQERYPDWTFTVRLFSRTPVKEIVDAMNRELRSGNVRAFVMRRASK